MEKTADHRFAADHSAAAIWQTWVTLATRIIIGIALVWAGLTKVSNLRQSVAAVQAYQLPFPDWMIKDIGYALPVVEIVIGAALIAGLFTRWVGVIGSLMLIAYIAGISSAWARGLNIDCGCFTPGGVLNPGQGTKYLQDILRDIGFLICGVWTVALPDAHFSVDRWIAGPTLDDVPDPDPAS